MFKQIVIAALFIIAKDEKNANINELMNGFLKNGILLDSKKGMG
jgi:hypothetical protein